MKYILQLELKITFHLNPLIPCSKLLITYNEYKMKKYFILKIALIINVNRSIKNNEIDNKRDDHD